MPPLHALEEIDEQFKLAIVRLAMEAKEAYAGYKLRRACQLIMELAQKGNVYFDAKKPWADAKQLSTKQRLETTIHLAIECIKILALIMSPILPTTAERIAGFLRLGINKEGLVKENSIWDARMEQVIAVHHPIAIPEVLFPKIEDDYLEQARIACSSTHSLT
jgi:methionyl-tRNA synthetase